MPLTTEAPLWQLLEKRKVTNVNTHGQITQAPLIGYEWFDFNMPPPLYEPDDNGIMWAVPVDLPTQRAYANSHIKPEVSLDLRMKCLPNYGSAVPSG